MDPDHDVAHERRERSAHHIIRVRSFALVMAVIASDSVFAVECGYAYVRMFSQQFTINRQFFFFFVVVVAVCPAPRGC